MPRWRSLIATRVIDPLGWKMKGSDVGTRLVEFRARQWDDPETWRTRQAELLAHLRLDGRSLPC